VRIIIAGSREFNNYQLLENECLRIVRELKEEGFNTDRTSTEIVSGTARGADKLGEQFANRYKLIIKQFVPDWNIGKQAGFIRNNNMAVYAKEDPELGVLIAFHNKTSKGTQHMINLATKHGLRVFVVNF
jgi:translation initiation factor IF-2